MTRWQLQDAKNRLSEVVRKAAEEGPQTITLRGRDAVVVVAAEEFARLARPAGDSLVDFLRGSPLAGLELDVERGGDAGRLVEL